MNYRIRLFCLGLGLAGLALLGLSGPVSAQVLTLTCPDATGISGTLDDGGPTTVTFTAQQLAAGGTVDIDVWKTGGQGTDPVANVQTSGGSAVVAPTFYADQTINAASPNATPLFPFSVTSGTTKDFTINYTGGTRVLNWRATCSGGTPTQQYTLNAEGSGTGTGTISGTGLDCTYDGSTEGPDCSETVDENTELQWTATATGGSTFTGWTGCDSTSGPGGSVCHTSVTANATVTANFDPPSTEADSASIVCNGNPDDTGVRSISTPAQGDWVTLNASGLANGVTVTFVLGAAPGMTVSPSKQSGDATGSFGNNELNNGNGYTTAYSVTGGSSATLRLTRTSNSGTWTSWRAYCSGPPVQQYTLTAEGGGSGTGTISGTGLNCAYDGSTEGPDCSETVDENTELQWTATATGGSTFTGWSGCDSTSGPGGSVCVKSVTANATVTANFDPPVTPQYTLTAEGSGTGTGTISGFGLNCAYDGSTEGPDCSETVDENAELQWTATATGSSTFTGWTGCDSTTGPGNSVCVKSVTANATVTANFASLPVAEEFDEATRKFLFRRMDRLVSDGPDRTRLLRKRMDRGYAGELAGSGGSGGDFDVTFGTSLHEIRAYAAGAADRKLEATGSDGKAGRSTYAVRMHPPGGSGADLPVVPVYEDIAPVYAEPQQSRFDLWVEGQYTSFDSDFGDGDFGVVYVGADYLVTENFLVGLLAQIDWMSQDEGADNVEGWGWMIGPYISAELVDNLFFDARFAWGQSDNDATVDVSGTPYSGNFDTDRWLASARLAGNIARGNWRLTPGIEVAYIEEKRKSFDASDGLGSTTTIDGTTLALGRLTAGPEFAYRFRSGSLTIEPSIALRLLWDFHTQGDEVSGMPVYDDGPRGAVEVGLGLRGDNGVAARFGAKYDGIGTGGGLDAWNFNAELNIPID